MAYYGNHKLMRGGFFNGSRVSFIYGDNGVVEEEEPETPETPETPEEKDKLQGYWLWNDPYGEGIEDNTDFSAKLGVHYSAPLISATGTYSALYINQGGKNLSYGSAKVYDTSRNPKWVDSGYQLIKITSKMDEVENTFDFEKRGLEFLAYLETVAIKVVCFHIGENDYLAKEGASWRSWGESHEDIVKFGEYYFSPPHITFDGNNAVMVDGYYVQRNGETVYADDLIESDVSFALSDMGDVTNTLAGLSSFTLAELNDKTLKDFK